MLCCFKHDQMNGNDDVEGVESYIYIYFGTVIAPVTSLLICDLTFPTASHNRDTVFSSEIRHQNRAAEIYGQAQPKK